MADAIVKDSTHTDTKTFSTVLDTYNREYNTNIQELKPLQVKALSIILSGKDCVCSLPTGYGKSLIFKLLPFIDLNCLVIVIEPLNDIREQETQKLGETAICLSGKGDLGFNNVKNGKVKYIFCHPEDILDNKRIVELFKSECVKSRNIFLVADEANCILDWGDHLTPDYKRLSNLRSLFECQILALSATVTSVGQRDIIKNLLMKYCLKQMIFASLQKPSQDCSIRLIFASVALGMGADLKNVKRVIHGAYVQEIGWAGRVGSHAKAILYYNNNDIAIKHMQASMKDY
ncbi:uncharacterized protein LOC132714144, partial [Ruditapes philippinarum]|uniref:uncharacterized protein LOC132714144 n=1 Tax=Ruditapes philippinarum TaxID=129788 RepID=UPI00295AE912